MPPLDLALLLLPFFVLAWAMLGRGPTAPGRAQAMLAGTTILMARAGGVAAVFAMFSLMFVANYLLLRRHRLPAISRYDQTPVELRDFRGGMRIAESVDATNFSHFLDFKQDIGTATFENRVYTDGAGTYLAFGRTSLKTVRADTVWMHSYFSSGEVISSSDEIRAPDYPVPFQCRRMKTLKGLNPLYAFHKAAVARHGAAPIHFVSESDFLDRLQRDARNRHRFALRSGYLKKVGDEYRYGLRVAAHSMLRAMNPVRPFLSELTVGGADPSTIPQPE